LIVGNSNGAGKVGVTNWLTKDNLGNTRNSNGYRYRVSLIKGCISGSVGRTFEQDNLGGKVDTPRAVFFTRNGVGFGGLQRRNYFVGFVF